MATVEVWLADLEPVSGFIARVCAAEAAMRQLPAEQTAALPDSFLAAWGELQVAVEDLKAAAPQVVDTPALRALP
jgi:hypothetical protein